MTRPLIGDPLKVVGEIVSAHAGALTARFPKAAVGDLCWISDRTGSKKYGQLTGFRDNLFSVSLFESVEGLSPRSAVYSQPHALRISVGPGLLGRVIDPLGRPLDSRELNSRTPSLISISGRAPAPNKRPKIKDKLETGVRAIDAFCTLGYGQRIGIFSSAGVGKSTLLAMIARQAAVDVIVVALVGERGREVREFIEDTLGSKGLERSVIVVATSDDSSLMRQTAPYTATAVAEFFRDCGKRVLLIVDSLTRLARAVREVSVAAGELPIRHGYTNSVYTELPKLLERAGNSPLGSITALYTVLTNQDEDIDPLADEIKSLLDGHLVLRRELSNMGIQPAIDPTLSVSRLFSRLQPADYCEAAKKVTAGYHRLFKEREIVLLGGTPDPQLKRLLENQVSLFSAINQPIHEYCSAIKSESLIRELGDLIYRIN